MLLGGYSTEVRKETVVSGTYSGIGRKKLIIVRKIAWVIGKLLPFTQRYTMTTKVTFGLTNGAGVVGHDKIANLFGAAREMFGLSRIPGFVEDAGRKYLLKTRDAEYHHYADFHFGDTIKTVIDVAEVNGANFKLRGRFINKETGKICATALQTIAYTNLQGKPVGFPKWLKILLELSCSQDAAEEKTIKCELTGGYKVYEHQVVVTSEMTNAERNVSHDEYAKMMIRTIEQFLLSGADDRQVCLLKVKGGLYKYKRDFFFGDKITIKLYVARHKGNAVMFEAEFLDETGGDNAYGRLEVN